jgi:hypothetical protein
MIPIKNKQELNYKNNKHSDNTQSDNTQIGGKVIASGGFGCIFNPPIKCETNKLNDKLNYDKIDDKLNYDKNNRISKLMINKYATEEYTQIQKFKSILKVIPNYSNYFLLDDFELCKPDKLTKQDLTNYKKCKALKKKGITKSNVNQSLNKIMVLNMPFGGINVGKFIENYFVSSNIIRLNNSLIDLLVNGIIPMNKLNVYHCDIKDENILVKIIETGLQTKLIDWGLSFLYTNKGMPRKIYRRPFQYNTPFSSILFNNIFVEKYAEFLSNNSKPTYYQIREFVINYIFIWNDIRGPGHLSSINNIIKKLTINDLTAIKKSKIKEHVIEYDFTYYYITEYITKILVKYTNNGSIDLISYFENVFLKNIDIWGFTMTYIVLYEYLYSSLYSSLNSNTNIEFKNKLKYIIIHFLYEKPIEPIDTSLLVKELTSLNNIINKFPLLKEFKKEIEVGGNKKTKTYKNTKRNNNKTKRKI